MNFLLELDRRAPRAVATIGQIKDAAANPSFSFATDANGRFVGLGTWPWKTPPVELAEPKASATARERRDHRTAAGLLTYSDELYGAFLQGRAAIAEAIAGEAELVRQGYAREALQTANQDLGRRVLRMVGGRATTGEAAAARIDEALTELAGKKFSDDEDAFARALQLPGVRPTLSVSSGDEETRNAAARAVYDVAIVQSLQRLTPAEHDALMHGAELPPVLKDGRVLAAVFSVPSPMLPYTAEEIGRIANIAFAELHPKTAVVARILAEQVRQVQTTMAVALMEAGKRAYPADPLEAFRTVQGGRWAAQAVEGHDAFAREMAEALHPRVMLDAVGGELWAQIANRSARGKGVHVITG